MLAQPFGLGLVIGERRRFLRQMRGLRQFHLDGVDAELRLAIVPRRPATLEPAVDHGIIAACREGDPADRRGDFGGTAVALIGANVEIRKLALEEERDMRPYGMAVVENDKAIGFVYALDLLGQRRMVRAVELFQPVFDVRGRRLLAIAPYRLAVEIGFGNEAGGILPRVKTDRLGSRLASMT